MLLCVFLLYCVLQESSGCTVERGLGPTITKSVGDSVVLPCFCENLQDDPQKVQWGYKKNFIGGEYEADHSVFPVETSKNQRYRDRVQRLIQKPGDLSLTISHLTEEDEGTYLCGNGGYNRAVKLYVRGCSVLDARTFTGSPGESVLLPCPCPNIKEKIEPQNVTWTKDLTEVSNHTESYRGRVWTFDQPHSRNFSLLISDLIKEDAGFYTCTQLYVTLTVKGCALSENKQTVPVSRSSGESVLLSCSCTDLQDTPPPVQWRTPNHEDLHQRYRDRVQTFNQSSPGNLSVLISDLTAEDGGTYSCWINQNQYRNFILTVKDCTLSETQENLITRSPGESVLLPCSCTDPNTKPVSVRWERVDSGGTEVFNETQLSTDRVHMFNKNLPANLSLLISNLTEQDQGTYRCSINNKQSINIRLSVKGCTVERGLGPTITKSVGDSVVLPCFCENLQDHPQKVQWGYKKNFIGGEYEVDHSVFPVETSQNQRYRDRVQRLIQKPGDLSLVISHLTEEDEGTYLCGNGGYNRSVVLYVRGCSVLESPIARSGSPGESVLLPCPCPKDLQNIKPQNVTWTKDQTAVSNHTVSYRGRVWTFDQTHSRNFSLLISDLIKEDAGSYTCTADEKNMPYVTLQVKGCALSENKQTVPVSRSSGESVILSCSCTDPPDTPPPVQWRTPNHEDLHQRYRDRVQTFNQSSPGNLSVLISDLTAEDGGTYSCWINQNQYRNFILTVKDCTLSETQENLITRSPGESVLLPCSCTDPNTKPVSVRWERVDSGGTEVFNETQLSTDRVHMFNKNLPANLSLLISNLTEQDQGTYRCSINNKQSINISLSVKVQNTFNPNSSLQLRHQKPIIITICTVLLLLLLGGAAYTYWKCGKGRKQSDENEAGQRRNEETDGDYQNDLPGNKNEISMGSVYPNLDPKTNQSDSVYPNLDPKTNQSDSVYPNLDPKTNQSDSVYQSLDPKTNPLDSVYQSLDPKTNPPDSVYQSLHAKPTNQTNRT